MTFDWLSIINKKNQILIRTLTSPIIPKFMVMHQNVCMTKNLLCYARIWTFFSQINNSLDPLQAQYIKNKHI